MITIERVSVMNWENAIRGARNPLNSWARSDSSYDENGQYVLGENDLSLAKRLAHAGSDHRKYLRQILVCLDITAPMYWWKEFDTYKVGTTVNSCSTMHKIHAKEFTIDDFSWDQLLNTGCDLFELEWGRDCSTMVQPLHFLIEYIIPVLNICRKKYIETKDKKYWWQMIQLLPSSYNQRRTVDFNYEVAMTMIRHRTGHKLDEWREFIKVLENLPYMKEMAQNNNGERKD